MKLIEFLVQVTKIHNGEATTTQFGSEEVCCLKYASDTSCEGPFSKLFEEILWVIKDTTYYHKNEELFGNKCLFFLN